MPFCSNCGKKLRDSDVFCYNCGHSVEEDKVTVSAVIPVEELPEQDHGVKIAEKLCEQFSMLEKVSKEISECERDLAEGSRSVTLPKYSAFRFFWKFLVIAGIEMLVINIIGAVIAIGSRDTSVSYVFDFIAIAVAAVILGCGGAHAKRKRDSYNSNIWHEEDANRQRLKELNGRLEELKRKQKRIMTELAGYNDIIPPHMRNSRQMEIVKQLIEAGRAGSLEDALKLCSFSN